MLTEQYYPPNVPAGLPSALLERRPDVKGAEDLLVAANANIGAAKALFFPNFSLTSTLGSATRDLSNLADRRAAVWSIAGGVLQPVFQGWRIFYNYEASKFRFEQAVAEYQGSAQNGFREVADALVTIDKLKDVRAEQETSVQALANAARLSRLRYDTGFANYLEILIADQQLFDQEQLLARTRGAQLERRGATLSRFGRWLAAVYLKDTFKSFKPFKKFKTFGKDKSSGAFFHENQPRLIVVRVAIYIVSVGWQYWVRNQNYGIAVRIS